MSVAGNELVVSQLELSEEIDLILAPWGCRAEGVAAELLPGVAQRHVLEV